LLDSLLQEKIMEEHKLVEITDKSGLGCKLCFRNVQDVESETAVQVGALFEYGVCRAHHFCLMFSSGLEQKGEEEEGIKGFMPDDVIKEWKRGGFLKCTYCKQKYATVGCVGSGCRKCYHLPCGIENGSLQQFFGGFSSFCSDHRPSQKPVRKPGKKSDKDCGICLDTLSKMKNDNLWTPCCGGWFHRDCVNRMASTAGMHFFKCPLCNNTEEFTQEMLNFGIYIPDQDAKWETEGAAFSDLLQRPNSCDAEICLCPGGREMDEVDTDWETSICVCCGSQGVHIKCGNLNYDRPRWKCDTCRSVVRSIPVKPVSVFSAVKRQYDAETVSSCSGLLARLKFKVGKERKPFTNLRNIELTIGRVVLSVDCAPVLDIPKPVGNQGKKDEKMDPTTNPTKESGKDNKPESTATKHNRPESTVTKDNKTESTATKDNKTESTATKDNKTESTATKDNKTESIATKGNKTESSAQLHDEDSPSDKKRKLSATDGKGESNKKAKPSADKSQTSILSFFKMVPKPLASSAPSSPFLKAAPETFTSTAGAASSSKGDVRSTGEEVRRIICISSDDDSLDDDDSSSNFDRDTGKTALAGTNSSKESNKLKAGGQFVCQFCKMSFSSLLSWKQHENSHRTGHLCALCDERFASQTLLKNHQKSHKQPGDKEMVVDEDLECPFCKFYAKAPAGLSIHIAKKHAEINLKKNGTATKPKKEEWIVANNGEDPEEYSCVICEASFGTRKGLNVHISKHSPVKDAVYQCKECPAILTSKKSYITHGESEHGITTLECEICDYVGNNKFNLQQHMRRHTVNNQKGTMKESKTDEEHEEDSDENEEKKIDEESDDDEDEVSTERDITLRNIIED